MPRVPDDLLNSVFYLFPNEEAAAIGQGSGGCGFFVEVFSEPPTGEFGLAIPHRYAITNRHVVEAGCLFMRVNVNEFQKTETFHIPATAWKFHPVSDIAIAALGEPTLGDARVITPRYDLTYTASDDSDYAARMNVGIGDDVVMVGRFIAHDGKQQNQPMVRFGHIAMMSGEPVRDGRNKLVNAYLVEMQSLPGFSGSPVFLHIGPASYRGDGTMTPFYQDDYTLLGIDTGHKLLTSDVRDKTTNRPADVPWRVLQNTGVAIVAPTAHIREVLNSGDFVAERTQAYEQWRKSRSEEIAASDVEDDDPDEFGRFHGLAQRLLAVRKDEVDDLREDR